MTHYTTIPYR